MKISTLIFILFIITPLGCGYFLLKNGQSKNPSSIGSVSNTNQNSTLSKRKDTFYIKNGILYTNDSLYKIPNNYINGSPFIKLVLQKNKIFLIDSFEKNFIEFKKKKKKFSTRIKKYKKSS